MPKQTKKTKARMERNRYINQLEKSLGVGERCDSTKGVNYPDSPFDSYSASDGYTASEGVKIKGPPKMEELELEGVKVLAVLDDLPPEENWQLTMEDPYLKIARPIPRTFMTDMMGTILEEMKKCTRGPLFQPFEGHEFYLPGDVKEIDLITREYTRRKMFAYGALKNDALLNCSHALEIAWEESKPGDKEEPSLQTISKTHCFLCNESPCVWTAKDLQYAAFAGNVKKLVKKRELAMGKGDKAMERLETYSKELRYQSYKDCVKAVIGNPPERVPLPECVELRVKYWFSSADVSPKFTGYLGEKKQII